MTSIKALGTSRWALLGLLTVGVLALLAACGGGKETSAPTAEPTATLTPDRQVAGASPAVKYEVINGMTVPPEPDAERNNATLAGVDVNANGIRDDVERQIAAKVLSKAEFDNAISIATIYQRVLVSGLSSQADADTFMVAVSCAGIKTTERLRRGIIQSLVLNTSERVKAFRSKTVRFDGPIINPAKDCH